MKKFEHLKVNIGCAKTILQRKPIFAAWHITYRCNMKCKFCSFWKNDAKIEEEFTVQQFMSSINPLLKLGIRVVNFAGGEPLIRKDIISIIREYSKYFIVIINTNGTFLSEDYARELWDAGTDIMNVSLDFFDAGKHDYYRGSNAYKNALDGIDLLQKTKKYNWQKIAIQSILSPENINEFEDMVKLADKKGINFTFNPYRFGDHEVDLSFSNSDLSFLYDLKKKYGAFLATEDTIKQTEEFLRTGQVGKCGMGKYMIAIDPYGNIGPCENMMQLNAGNILETSVSEVQQRLTKITTENLCNHCLTRERSEVEPLYEGIGSRKWLRESLAVKKG